MRQNFCHTAVGWNFVPHLDADEVAGDQRVPVHLCKRFSPSLAPHYGRNFIPCFLFALTYSFVSAAEEERVATLYNAGTVVETKGVLTKLFQPQPMGF